MRHMVGDKRINILGMTISICFFLLGIAFKSTQGVLFASLMVVFLIAGHAAGNLKAGIVLLFYTISLTTFMLTIPIINFFAEPSANQEYYNSLVVLYIAVLSIDFGAILYKSKKTNNVEIRKYRNSQMSSNMKLWIVQKISGWLFYATLIFVWAVSAEKIMVVQSVGYIGLYTRYHSMLPFIVQKLAVINEICFVAYLVTFPSKRKTYIAFFFYGIGLVLQLMTGVRGNVVISLMMIMTYSFIRNSRVQSKKIFAGKRTKWLIVALGILFISYMGIYSSIRQGESGGSLISGFGTFFRQQGGSINVLRSSIENKNYLRSMNSSYSFYTLIHSNDLTEWISRLISGKSQEMSDLYTGNLGNNITYLGDRIYYEAGGGYGTSYLAELFVDFSYFGIVIYNICLGYILKKAMDYRADHWIYNTYYFLIIRCLYYLPRDFSLNFVAQILSISNIVLIVGIKLISDLLVKIRYGGFRIESFVDE